MSVGEEDRRRYLACEDDGVGMGLIHLQQLFARAGRRFSDTHEYHLDHARWQEAGLPFWPNSRFGIGVLSYFMLADEIRVETRRFESDGSLATEGLVARVTGTGSLFHLTSKSSARPLGGTKVTLFLNDTTLDLDDLLDSVTKWLLFTEIYTILRYSRRPEDHLEAGQITSGFKQRFGNPISIEEFKSTMGYPRVFWVPSAVLPEVGFFASDRPVGGILSDGIIIGDNILRPLLIVNASEDILIRVSADRNRIIDCIGCGEWVDLLLDGGGRLALLNWKQISLVNMAALFSRNRKELIALDKELRSGAAGGKSIPFSTTKEDKVDIAAGICELDYLVDDDLLDGVGQPSGNSTDDLRPFDQIASALVRSRLCELQGSGLGTPAELRSLVDFTQKRWPGRQPLRLGSVSLVIDDVEDWRRPRRRLRVMSARRRLDASRIFDVTVRWRTSLAEVVEVARPLAGLGIVVPDLDQLAAMPQPDGRLGELLSRDVDGTAPFVNQVDAGQLIRASAKWGISLAEVVELARPLAAFGIVAADLDRLAAIPQPDGRLVELLSWDPFGTAPFVNQVDVGQLIRASAKWGISLAEVVELARPLAGFGLVEPDLDQLAAMPQPDGRLGELLSRDLDGKAPFVNQVDVGQLIRASAKWGISLAEVVELARPLAGFGLVEPDLDRLAAMPQPDGRLVELLSWDLDGTPPFVKQVDAGRLIRASAKWGISLAEVVELARPLAGFGLVEPDLDQLAAMPQLDAARVFRIAGSLEGNHSPHQMVLEMLAHAEHLSVAEIFFFSRNLQDAGLCNVALPNLDTSLDEKLLRLMARTIGAGCRIDPLSVALVARRATCQITDLRPALEVLASFDVDCAEALEFVQFCSERELVETPFPT